MVRIFLFFFFIVSFSYSQNYKQRAGSQKAQIYGKISGVIKDAETKDILPYASVSLISVDSLQVLDGTITNEKGVFVFNNLMPNPYIITISYNGYISKTIESEITPKKLNKNLKNILLEIDTYLLQDVKLSTEAPVYENKIEKIVYNVANDLSQSANDGIDILRNAPLVSVDIDDKVSLRGSENVKFLLNGKTSSFLNKDNISDVLQTIPAEQIKSIEVITSPGAKYDAEGDAGIINIVTYQKIIEGFNATVNTSTGTRVNRTSFNLNAGKNRFGISASGGARYGWPRDGNTSVLNTTFDQGGQVLNSQAKNGNFIGNWIGFRGAIDLYYDINSFNSITANFNLGGSKKTNDGCEEVINTFYDVFPDIYIYNQYLLSDTSINNDTEYEYTVNYIKSFQEEEGRELVVSFQYGRHVHDDKKDLYQNFIMTPSDNINFIKNKHLGKGHEITGQIDYVHPFGDDNKLELGVKHIDRRTKMNYSTDFPFSSGSLFGLEYELFSDILQYNQQVSAIYVSTQLTLPNDFGVLLGARFEHTSITSAYLDDSEQLDNILIEPQSSYNMTIDKFYSNLVPSVTFSKKLNMFQTLKISYANRIQRPDVHKVNSNIEVVDFNSIDRGNPALSPSESHQIELGYTSFKPGLMTSFFAYYKKQIDIVESYTFLIDDGNSYETNYANTGDNQSVGFNFFGSTTIRKVLTLRGGLDIYSYNMSTNFNSVDLARKSLNYKYNFSANIKLGKGYKLESRAFFRSPRQTIQGERPSFSMMSFGFKKEFSNKRGSIGLGVIEPFKKYKSFNTSIEGESANGTTFENSRDYQILFRSINLKFKYNFGKIDFNPIKKKAILENNDTDHEHDEY